MNYKVISFYRYAEIKDPQSLREELYLTCCECALLGRILLGKEGINGAVSGEGKNIELFKQKMTVYPLFSNLTFREQSCAKNAYHKLVVRVRKEIVAFGRNVDINNKGIALSPQELKQWYDQKENFIIVDARNDYEYAVGKFKDAIGLPIKKFREFPQMLPNLKPYQNKKLVLYCTGGIRCEKASAYLMQQGFKDVYQLEGGIINYVSQFPNTFWEGNCFIFDDRLVSNDGKPITSCTFCSHECGEYINCYNLDCDKLFVCCQSCCLAMSNTCSAACSAAPRQRKAHNSPNYQKIGIVQNYYSKSGVAEVKVNKMLSTKMVISFKGKTTPVFKQEITELRDNNGNEIECSSGIVTFPVFKKVRKNDLVVVES